ncbi:MAG: hypothetical protein IV093_07015 [Rubrivivax sp.]|nr:hypothetical protein [Rubrivivax sp.]
MLRHLTDHQAIQGADVLNVIAKGLATIALVQAALLGAVMSSSASAQGLPREVQVGTRTIIDFEFDWGRDGVHCPACNYGAGNSRLAFTDEFGQVWVGYIDPTNGYFYPTDGQAVLVDTKSVTAQKIGNGPEWMVSQRGSELVYTRWTDKRPQTFNNISLGHAYMGAGGWIAGSIPDSKGYVLPVGSLNLDDSVPMINYQNFSTRKTDTYYRVMAQDTAQFKIDIGSSQPGVTRRWVPGTHKIIMTFQVESPESDTGPQRVFRQVFLYSPNTDTLEQLTFDPENKYWAFMWQAPEYNNEYLFFVMVGGRELHIYRRLKQDDGTFAWTVINKISMPKDNPFIVSPEPMVYNGKSWIYFTVSPKRGGHNISAASQVAITGIVPGESEVRVLTADAEGQTRARRDPEHFITANGPYIYYNRYVPRADGQAVSEGVFRIDTGLGVPQAQMAPAAPARR